MGIKGISEFELIQKSKEGDHSAFRLLVEQNQNFLYAVAYKILGNEDDALDAVQDSFVKVWKKLHLFDTKQIFKTWLYRIISNTCLDILRQQKTKPMERISIADLNRFIEDNTLEIKEMVIMVYDLVHQLPEKQRVVFVLRDLEGLSVAEVSKILKLSSSKIKSNLYNARIQMRKMLELMYSESKEGEK